MVEYVDDDLDTFKHTHVSNQNIGATTKQSSNHMSGEIGLGKRSKSTAMEGYKFGEHSTSLNHISSIQKFEDRFQNLNLHV